MAESERIVISGDGGTTSSTTSTSSTAVSSAPVTSTSTTTTSGGRRVYGGLYSDTDAAERGIKHFQSQGYSGDRIGIVSRDTRGAAEIAEHTGSDVVGGATKGAVTGGILGGLTGLLVGIGALAIPGIGPVLAGGALASAFGLGGGTALAGAGIGAGIGGLIGALTGLGFSEDEAKYYDEGVRGGQTLVTVHDDDGRADTLFDETGASRYRGGSTATTSRTVV